MNSAVFQDTDSKENFYADQTVIQPEPTIHYCRLY